MYNYIYKYIVCNKKYQSRYSIGVDRSHEKIYIIYQPIYLLYSYGSQKCRALDFKGV